MASTTDSSLETDFEYFLENLPDLSNKFKNRWVVIRDKQIHGDYATEMEALKQGAEQFELGTFLVQLCSTDAESYTQTFHSRVG